MERDTFSYVALRLAMRFMPSACRIRAFLLRGQLAPAAAYRPDPEAVAASLEASLGRVGGEVEGKNIVALGCGPSNGLGYALIARGAARVWCLDPGVRFDVGLDAKHLNSFVVRHPRTKFHTVDRINALAAVPAGGADVVLVPVLPEARVDPAALLIEAHRVLAPGGVLLLRRVYGDALIRYPFHALLFSKRVWRWFLAMPGKGRRRYDEDLGDLARAGFAVTELDIRRDPEGYSRVAGRLHADFSRRDPAMLSVVDALLCCRSAKGRETGGA